MAYKLFNQKGEQIVLHDLQDKGPWCATGSSYEQVFIAKYGSNLGLVINPKKTTDIYAPDLYNQTLHVVGDLKTQNTPFFQAATRYKLNPQYAVTFNVKDYKRYLEYYPTIEIYFWVDWLATGFESFTKIQVLPMSGVWKIPFGNILKLAKTAPIHIYQQRIFDTAGNAKGSYVFELTNPAFTKVI